MKKISQKQIFTLIAFILILFASYSLQEAGLFEIEKIKKTVELTGTWGPAIFIFFYFLGTLLFIPATPLTFLGGIIFGPFVATFYISIAAILSSVLSFVIGKKIGRDAIDKLLEIEKFFQNQLKKIFPNLNILNTETTAIEKYEKKLQENGLLGIIILRTIPIPFAFLNTSLGMSGIGFKNYFLGTLFSIPPITFAYAFFGEALASPSPKSLLISFLLILSLWLIKKQFHPNKKKTLA